MFINPCLLVQLCIIHLPDFTVFSPGIIYQRSLMVILCQYIELLSQTDFVYSGIRIQNKQAFI